MPYTNAMATPRSDIYALVQQANADFNKLLIADKVFPVKSEDVKRGIFMKASLANAELLNADASPREAGASYKRVNRKYDTDTFDCVEYGLETAIDDAYEAEVERFMNLEAVEAGLLERSLRLSYEQRVSDLLMSTSGGIVATAAIVSYTETLLSTINFPADVAAARKRMLKNGKEPNALVMNADVWHTLARSPLLQNQIYGVVPRTAGQNALPSEQDVANALGFEFIYVGKAAKNANKKGQTFSGGFVWPTTYVAVCEIKGGEYTAGGVGRTIQWSKDTTGLFTPETYRDDRIRSNVMRVRQHTAEKVIDATACELITTSWSAS